LKEGGGGCLFKNNFYGGYVGLLCIVTFFCNHSLSKTASISFIEWQDKVNDVSLALSGGAME
jgi:hypothetical protein